MALIVVLYVTPRPTFLGAIRVLSRLFQSQFEVGDFILLALSQGALALEALHHTGRRLDVDLLV